MTEVKECAAIMPEMEARAERLAVSQEAERRQRIRARLEKAMIAPRFADKTLDNFETLNDGQREAVRAARWLLDNLDSGTPGLIFLGSNGTGKNHLSSAIVREAIEKHGKTALITKVRKLDRAIKEAWRKDGLESEVIRSFIEPHILVIDEIGLQRGSETEMLHLTEVIDDRYEAMKPTILCGNLTLKEFNGIIGDRAVDRFKEGGRIVAFTWESYR